MDAIFMQKCLACNKIRDLMSPDMKRCPCEKAPASKARKLSSEELAQALLKAYGFEK